MARTRFSPWRGEMFIEKTDEPPAPFGEAEWFLKGTARVDSASPNGEGGRQKHPVYKHLTPLE